MRGRRTDNEENIELTPEEIQKKIEEKKESHKKLTTLQIKTMVEKKAWESLDFFFDELDATDGAARETAKIAVGVLAIVSKDRQLDIHERTLDQKRLLG